MIKYINYKRINDTFNNHKLNIPYGSEFISIGKSIIYNSEELCFIGSQYFVDHFVLYDEWYKERLQIIPNLFSKLQRANKNRNSSLWKSVWNDKLCWKYKEPNIDAWFWTAELNSAPIEDLRYIANLLKIKYN